MFGISRTYIHLSAKRLDKIYPGWHNQINTSRLNMKSDHDCILGQIGRFHGYNFTWANDKVLLPFIQNIESTLNNPQVPEWKKFIVFSCGMVRLIYALVTFVASFCMGKDHWIRQINARRRQDEYAQVKRIMDNGIVHIPDEVLENL